MCIQIAMQAHAQNLKHEMGSAVVNCYRKGPWVFKSSSQAHWLIHCLPTNRPSTDLFASIPYLKQSSKVLTATTNATPVQPLRICSLANYKPVPARQATLTMPVPL